MSGYFSQASHSLQESAGYLPAEFAFGQGGILTMGRRCYRLELLRWQGKLLGNFKKHLLIYAALQYTVKP